MVGSGLVAPSGFLPVFTSTRISDWKTEFLFSPEFSVLEIPDPFLGTGKWNAKFWSDQKNIFPSVLLYK